MSTDTSKKVTKCVVKAFSDRVECRDKVTGQLHSYNDKPAIEWNNGDKWWYYQGELHRDNDKPAIEYSGGAKEWWYKGKQYSEEEYKKLFVKKEEKPQDGQEIVIEGKRYKVTLILTLIE